MSSLVIPVTGGIGPVLSGGVGSHLERVIDRVTSAILWDLNDPTGANNPYQLQTRIRSFDLGTVERRQEFLEPDGPIDQLLYQRAGRARAQWIIRCTATSYDALRLSLGELHKLLTYNQVILHQPDGQAEALYLDTLPAPTITPLLRGQGVELESKVLRDFEDVDYLVVVWRQGALRSPELDPTVNKATNPFHLVDVGGDGRPDGWEWSSTVGLSAESIDAATETYKFTRASAATVDFRETAANADTAAPGDVWSGQIKARASSGSTARARALVEFLDAANAVLRTDLGTLTVLGTAETTLTVTSSAAPATTAKVRVGIRFENSDTAANICHTRDPQVEKASTASTHRAGEQPATLDPTAGLSGMLLKNRGPAPAPYVVTANSPDSSSKIAEMLLALRSSEGLDGNKRIADLVGQTGWANLESSARGWTVTLENDTSPFNDSGNGSVGNVAAVSGTSANVGIMLRRLRLTRTTKLDSLRGWEYVWLRLRTSGASEWEIQLRWSRSLADPASVTRVAVTHDTMLATSFGYVEIPLGFIDLPEDPAVPLSGMALEIWARQVDSAAPLDKHLYMDLIRLLPATPGRDVLTRIVVPDAGSETWLGKDLVTPLTNPSGGTAGTVSDDALLLDTTSDNAGVPPAAGGILASGHHQWEFDIEAPPSTAALTLRVRNITTSSDHQVLTKNYHPGSRALHRLETDISNTNLYEVQLDDPGATGFKIHSVTHTFIPAVAQNEQVRSDPLRWEVERLEADGDLLGTLKPEGPVPFWIPPGLAAVFGVPLDIRRPGYGESESVKARTLTLSGKGAPRRPF